MIQKSNTCAGFISAFSRSIKGFTLIELLVVVIIIAVLTAVAMPMYKRAVLKSRFTTVMPMAKAVADAQEVYFLGNGQYALDKAELDITPVEANNTTVALSPTDGYDYVLAQRSDVPEVHYIMYQKHSENYPGEIHCEAQDENDMATYLCQSIGGTQDIGKTITDGYTTYIISGTGSGFPVGYNALLERVDCAGAEALGFTCEQTVDGENNTVSKKICTTVGVTSFCRTRTYNEDGSYTSVTCQVNNNGVCTSSNWHSATYDAAGNKLTVRDCKYVSSGNCTAYIGGGYNYDFTYDANGNMLSQQLCTSMDSSGNCAQYSSGYSWTYDMNGNMLAKRDCNWFDSSGNCMSYGGGYEYTYDAAGNRIIQRDCNRFDSSGNCTAYAGAYNYTYDANGNMLSQRECNGVYSNGRCMGYSNSGENYNYTYDANGNMLTKRRCSNGNCTAYNATYNYTYDANGNQLTSRTCSSVDSNGNCTSYTGTSYKYTYDDNGKQVYYQTCSGSNLNTATGECIAYNSTTVQNN